MQTTRRVEENRTLCRQPTISSSNDHEAASGCSRYFVVCGRTTRRRQTPRVVSRLARTTSVQKRVIAPHSNSREPPVALVYQTFSLANRAEAASACLLDLDTMRAAFAAALILVGLETHIGNIEPHFSRPRASRSRKALATRRLSRRRPQAPPSTASTQAPS